MNPTFDEQDADILSERREARDKQAGPRLGDYVQMTDGTLERIAHDWGKRVQTSDGAYGMSFYLGKGFAEFSGGLNSSFPKAELVDTGATKDGWFWFFHHDWHKAHNGVSVAATCRVYKRVA